MSHELLRPRSVTGLLDVAFSLIRAHLPVFATLAVVAALPVLATSAVTIAAMPEAAVLQSGDGAAAEAAAAASLGRTLIVLPFTIAAWLWFFVAGAAMIFATADAYRGQPLDAGSAFRRAMRATGDVLGANIAKYILLFVCLMGVGIVGGIVSAAAPVLGVAAILAGIAGVAVAYLRWYVVTPVAALEEVTGSDALGRSAKLMTGAKRRALLMQAVLFALAVAFSFVNLFVLGLASSFAGSTAIAGLAGSLWLLGYPFVNVLEAVLYFDQRIRTEAFDLEVLAQQLGPTATPDAPFARQPF